MAFTKARISNYSYSSDQKTPTQELRQYKPRIGLHNEWPEVFERRVVRWPPRDKWDRGPFEEEVVVFKDPRSDLASENPEESYWWCWLLADAWNVSRELAVTLHGFRCMGTRLERKEKGFVLKPEVSERAWASEEEYQEARNKYLMPYKEQLTRLLRKQG